MKQIIENVLEDLAGGQLNFESKSARELITKNIVSQLQIKGEYHEHDDSEIENQLAQEDWVCSICNKNTYHVDWDYIGSNTNHLQCELELEMETNTIQKQIYNEITADGLPSGGDTQAVLESYKLADEIIDNIENGIIYESPDGGKTVFQRPIADFNPENKIEIDWKTKEPTGRVFSDYNNGHWDNLKDEG